MANSSGQICPHSDLAAGSISAATVSPESLSKVVGAGTRLARRRQVAMKLVKASQDLIIPDDIKMEIKARKIRVTGPRGKLFALDSPPFRTSCQPIDVTVRLRQLHSPLRRLTAELLCYLQLLQRSYLGCRYFDQGFQAFGS